MTDWRLIRLVHIHLMMDRRLPHGQRIIAPLLSSSVARRDVTSMSSAAPQGQGNLHALLDRSDCDTNSPFRRKASNKRAVTDKERHGSRKLVAPAHTRCTDGQVPVIVRSILTKCRVVLADLNRR